LAIERKQPSPTTTKWATTAATELSCYDKGFPLFYPIHSEHFISLLFNIQSIHSFNPFFLLLNIQIENVRMLDRYNSRKPSTGTLYLTATHLIFVDPDAKKETWVRTLTAIRFISY